MNRIPIKPLAWQDLQSLQRVRERLVKTRTGDINQLRGLLAEYGEVLPQGPSALRRRLADVLAEPHNELTPIARELGLRLFGNIQHLNEQIEQLEHQLQGLLSTQADYQRLCAIPGIGPVVAATLLASIGGNIERFKNGRQLAAWLGLSPSQHSSGERQRLGPISQRGNLIARKLLIHGARTVLNWCERKTDALSLWLQRLKQRLPAAKVIVALANKLARICWVVLARGVTFDPAKACA